MDSQSVLPPKSTNSSEDESALFFTFTGNPGSGKSYLSNMIIGEEVFEHDLSPDAVTTCIGEHKIIHPIPCTILNLPGLMEMDKAAVERNVRALKEALSKEGLYMLIFVFAAGVGGRIQSKDIFAYNQFCKGYGLKDVPIIMNNLLCKPEEETMYYATFCETLKGVGITAPCQIVAQNAPREVVLKKVFAMAEAFPWQRLTKEPKEMIFDEADEAYKAEEKRQELKISAIRRSLEQSEVQKKIMMEAAEARLKQQQAAFERLFALYQEQAALKRESEGSGNPTTAANLRSSDGTHSSADHRMSLPDYQPQTRGPFASFAEANGSYTSVTLPSYYHGSRVHAVHCAHQPLQAIVVQPPRFAERPPIYGHNDPLSRNAEERPTHQHPHKASDWECFVDILVSKCTIL